MTSQAVSGSRLGFRQRESRACLPNTRRHTRRSARTVPAPRDAQRSAVQAQGLREALVFGLACCRHTGPAFHCTRVPRPRDSGTPSGKTVQHRPFGLLHGLRRGAVAALWSVVFLTNSSDILFLQHRLFRKTEMVVGNEKGQLPTNG